MKKIFFLFTIFFITLTTKAQQRFAPGVKIGLSTSQMMGDDYSGFHKAGFEGGATLSMEMNKKWSAQFEVYYLQKGSKHLPDWQREDFIYYYCGLDYLEIPFLFQYHQKKFVFDAGVSMAYLIKETEFYNESEISGIRPFNLYDIGFAIGISYSIFRNIGINWRFTNSLNSTRDFASQKPGYYYYNGQKNNVLAFTLTYKFVKSKFEEKDEKQK